MKTLEERIAELEARLASAEARIAQLEARPQLPSIPMVPQPWNPPHPPLEVWSGTSYAHPAPHAAQALVPSPGCTFTLNR